MILICAVDYFRKYQKCGKWDFFLKKKVIQNSSLAKIQGFGVVLPICLDEFEITCTSIRKNALKTLILFKILIFISLNRKNCEVIRNFSKAPLNSSSLKCTYLGKNHFNIISAKSEKNEIESGHSVYVYQLIYPSAIRHGSHFPDETGQASHVAYWTVPLFKTSKTN